MKSIQYLLIFSYVVFLYSCSSSVETTSQNKTYIQSSVKSNNLVFKIPTGWKEIKDNNEQLFDVWLVNNDNSASICFVQITLSEQIDYKNENEKLDILEKILTTKRKVSSNNFEIIENSELPLEFANKQIKFSIAGEIQNSILFGKDKNYYECIAYFDNSYSPSQNEQNTLFETQRKILQSIKIDLQK